jgi:hypothetical protein
MTSAAVTLDESRRSVADLTSVADYEIALARGSFLVDDNVDAGR